MKLDDKRYSTITLECEKKLTDFYKKFSFQKLNNTMPSQFDDEDGINYYLMFLPLIDEIPKDVFEKYGEEVLVMNLVQIKKKYGYDVGEKNGVRVWKSLKEDKNLEGIEEKKNN